jgi:hypothetical protein
MNRIIASFCFSAFALLGTLNTVKAQADQIVSENYYKSHEYPVLQIEKDYDSKEAQQTGDSLAKAYLDHLKSKYPDKNAELVSLDDRRYKIHGVRHQWLHVLNGQVIFNFGE